MRLLALAVLLMACAPRRTDIWASPQRGTNYFARPMTTDWLRAAPAAGVRWVRLTTAMWPAEGRDHLLGSADGYHGISPLDLAALRDQLDLAHRERMRVVLTKLSLPGARWRQHNGYEDDLRLWSDLAFQDQTVALWRDLALAVGDHPALVAVNVVNEPRPPSGAALSALYRRVLGAIREVRPALPVMLDVGTDAAPASITELVPIDDPAVLYGVHLYEPWELVTWRIHEGRLGYPGPAPKGELVDAAFLRRTLQAVADWQQRWAISPNRVVLAEFGIDRRIRGALEYLRDAICVAEHHGWHWAFYAYRDWQAMDYEVRYRPLPDGYWAAEQRGVPMDPPAARAPTGTSPPRAWPAVCGAHRGTARLDGVTVRRGCAGRGRPGGVRGRRGRR